MQTDAVYGKLQLCGADIARSTYRLTLTGIIYSVLLFLAVFTK
jgi:hypothetical protein